MCNSSARAAEAPRRLGPLVESPREAAMDRILFENARVLDAEQGIGIENHAVWCFR